MKRLLLISCLFAFTLISSAQPPDFVWEKYYQSVNLSNTNILRLRMNADKNNIYLLYSDTDNNTAHKEIFPGFIVADFHGNVLQQKEYLDKGDNLLYKFMYKENNYYKIIGTSYSSPIPIFLKLNQDFNTLEILDDTINYYINDFFLRNDSLFFLTPGRERINNVWQYQFRIDIYSPDIEFLTRIPLDTTSSELDAPAYLPFHGSGLIVKSDYFLLFTGGAIFDDASKYKIIIKYDRKGNIIWSKKIFDENYSEVGLYDIYEDKEGNIYGTGYAFNAPYQHHFLCKLDSEGNILWQTVSEKQGRYNLNEFCSIMDDQYFVVGGYRQHYPVPGQNSYVLFIYDSNGNLIKEYNWSRGEQSEICGIVNSPDNNIIVFGRASFGEMYLAEISISSLSTSYPAPAPALSLHPNPTSDFITISGMNDPTQTIDIYTLAGVNIMSAEGPRVDVSHLAPGFYFVRVGGRSLKFVKI
ncbi:MAG: T9SS type A sorting domain-containing protein [Candidatus Kapaibacterium sp.]